MPSGTFKPDHNANANGVEMGDTTSSRADLMVDVHSSGHKATKATTIILVVFVLILFTLAAVFIGLYAHEKLNQKTATEEKGECGTKGCVTVAAGMGTIVTYVNGTLYIKRGGLWLSAT